MRKTWVQMAVKSWVNHGCLGTSFTNLGLFNFSLGTNGWLCTFLTKVNQVLIPSVLLNFSSVNGSLIHTIHIANNKYN